MISAAPREGESERLGIGVFLCLGGFGIAAAATIVAFVGIGSLLLAERPLAITPSDPPAGIAAKSSLASAIDAAAGSLPSVATEATPSPPSNAKRAAVAIAPAGSIPVLSPPLSAVPDKAAPAQAAPAPTPVVRAETAPPAATAAPLASASPQLANREGSTAQPMPSTPLPEAEISALLAQGDEAFRRGDLASARLLYRRAYEAQDGRGALGIGATYDPAFLRRYQIWTQFADPEEARIWYMRANDLGAQEAQTRLKRLDAKPAR